jgi:hypothetical protein
VAVVPMYSHENEQIAMLEAGTLLHGYFHRKAGE